MTSGQRATATLATIALLLILGFSWGEARRREAERERRETVESLLRISDPQHHPPTTPVTTTAVLGEMLIPIGGVTVLAGLGMVLTAPRRS